VNDGRSGNGIARRLDQHLVCLGVRSSPGCTEARLRGFDILWLNGDDLRPLSLSERRRLLQAILPAGSPTIAEPLSVVGRGSELFELICAHDLEGIVAKRLRDPYERRVRWLKIKNPDYSQKEGRADLFNGPRTRPRLAGGR